MRMYLNLISAQYSLAFGGHNSWRSALFGAHLRWSARWPRDFEELPEGTFNAKRSLLHADGTKYIHPGVH